MIDIISLVRERIGVYPKYEGFNMGKTHSQEEKNLEIDKHNKEIIKKFSDILDIDYICEHLDCWKGTMVWDNDCNLLAGWASEDIIKWLIENKRKEVARVISKEDRYNILRRQKWRCNSCGCKLKYNKNSSWEGEVAHIDHIHPYSERLTYQRGILLINELQNLQALCPKCNKEKWKKKS